MKLEPGRCQKPPSHSGYGQQSDSVLYGQIDRVTPSGRGIPAQAYVKWDNNNEGWELCADLQQRFRSAPRAPSYTGAEFK